MAWVPARPYLIPEDKSALTIERLDELGFQVVIVDVRVVDENFEEALLVELSAKLGLSALGAGSWAAFNDRLWDFMAADRLPVGIVIRHFDRVMNADVHAFVRCIHNFLSMTASVGLSELEADLQMEFLFAGNW